MNRNNDIENNSNFAKKRNRFFPIVVIVSVVIVATVFSSIFFTKRIKENFNSSVSITNLINKWNDFNYQEVYDISRQLLDDNQFNNIALVYHGYSSFYLAISQNDTSIAQSYLDEAINCIRLAYYDAKNNILPQLEYMLGKAYFYKNTVTSYYYADLSLKYLKLAQEHGYKANDIAEYMGLSYAALGKPMESIASFTEALLVRESDSLLLSIAEQYYKIGQSVAAKQYLYRIKNNSDDDNLVLKSMNLLGMIYIDEKKWSDAKEEFESILKKRKNSADAYYGLGVIYEKQGDFVKARAEWRKALKVQVNHSKSIAKIAEYTK